MKCIILAGFVVLGMTAAAVGQPGSEAPSQTCVIVTLEGKVEVARGDSGGWLPAEVIKS